MIKTKTVTYEHNVVVSKICDKCKKEYDAEKDRDECQEFHAVSFVGGYGSIFGDGTGIHCDLCQHCLLDIIKDYMRISEYKYY
jgi:hypothetical protein